MPRRGVNSASSNQQREREKQGKRESETQGKSQTQVLGGNSEGKRRERKKKGKKERMERKKRREGVVAGHGRWSPAAARGGRNPVSQAQARANGGGASVVKSEKLEFCKRDFGERSNSSLERVFRGRDVTE